MGDQGHNTNGGVAMATPLGWVPDGVFIMSQRLDPPGKACYAPLTHVYVYLMPPNGGTLKMGAVNEASRKLGVDVEPFGCCYAVRLRAIQNAPCLQMALRLYWQLAGGEAVDMPALPEPVRAGRDVNLTSPELRLAHAFWEMEAFEREYDPDWLWDAATRRWVMPRDPRLKITGQGRDHLREVASQLRQPNQA